MYHQELTIVGAGPAGLAAGFYAKRADIPFTLYEANDCVGGNARTIMFGQFRFDTGAHRFHSQDMIATRDLRELMGNELLEINVPSQIVFNNRFIDFPLSPLNLIGNYGVGNLMKAGVDYTRAKFSNSVDQSSFESAVIKRYGRNIAASFLLGYTEKLWGVPPSQLSPRVSGKRLRGLNLRTFLLEAFGGSRVKTEHLDGRFYYPRSGIGAIMERFADSGGRENLRLNSRVTAIHTSGSRIGSIEINQQEQVPVSNLVSSLPLSVLLRNLNPAPPAEILELVRKIQFRNVVLIVLTLDRQSVTPNASLYFRIRSCLSPVFTNRETAVSKCHRREKHRWSPKFQPASSLRIGKRRMSLSSKEPSANFQSLDSLIIGKYLTAWSVAFLSPIRFSDLVLKTSWRNCCLTCLATKTCISSAAMGNSPIHTSMI